MGDSAPEENSPATSIVDKAAKSISEVIRGVLGFFHAYVQIARDANTPISERIVILVTLAIIAFGLFALIFNNNNLVLILTIPLALLFAFSVYFVSRRTSDPRFSGATLFAISIFVYEGDSRKEKPIKNATIKLMLDPHPVELDKTPESGIVNYSLEQRHYDRKIQVIVNAPGFAVANQNLKLTSKRIEIPLTRLLEKKSGKFVETKRSSSLRVRVQMGDILEGGYDLTVLPSSAKGTISSAVRRHTENYDISAPQPQKHGSISELIPFKGTGNRTKFFVYAASVFNDYSSTEIIEEIGRQIGDLTVNNPDILLIEAPLLGTGAGRLDTLEAAFALKKGFESTSTRASLTIFVYDFARYQEISKAFSESQV